MRLFVGNFEFEHHLAGGRARQLPASVQRLSAETACTLVALADEGDLLWLPAEVEAGFLDALVSAGMPRVRPVGKKDDVPTSVVVTPWGWTDRIRDWASRHGWSYVAPAQQVIREVNSRRFSHRLEQDTSSALPGACEIQTVDELATAIDRLPPGHEQWVIKAEFSMAARERFLGRGRRLSPQAAGWMKRRLAHDGVVFFEPWVEPDEEVGIQFDVTESESVQLVGVTPLLTDATGAYRGSRVGVASEVERRWSTTIDTARGAVEQMQKLGYFGPVGIDALRYRDPGGTIRERPLMDINARWTMGRLSLGFRRLLKTGELATWLHVRWPTVHEEAPRQWYDAVTQKLPPSVRVVRTSPFVLGDRPTGHATLLLVSPSAVDLLIAERTLLASQTAGKW